MGTEFYKILINTFSLKYTQYTGTPGFEPDYLICSRKVYHWAVPDVLDTDQTITNNNNAFENAAL
jgi:hypothetical protein